MKISIGCDHGALELKNTVVAHLQEKGYTVVDFGTHTLDSCDYPDYAALMAKTIKEGKAERGILTCGTGIGISIAANRFPHIRAALVHDAFGARLCRQHNNANVLVMGGRTTGIEVAFECVDIFLKTEFEGGRHANRVNKLSSFC